MSDEWVEIRSNINGEIVKVHKASVTVYTKGKRWSLAEEAKEAEEEAAPKKTKKAKEDDSEVTSIFTLGEDNA